MSASLLASSGTKAERVPLLSNKSKVSPLPRALDGHGFSSGNDDADIDTSGTSVRSASDAVTFDAMMQLSVPRNPLQHAKVRAFVLWLTMSAILFLTNQLTTLPVGFFPAYAQQHFGMTATQLSLFFAVYPLCIMLSSPLATSVSPAVGAKPSSASASCSAAPRPSRSRTRAQCRRSSCCACCRGSAPARLSWVHSL